MSQPNLNRHTQYTSHTSKFSMKGKVMIVYWIKAKNHTNILEEGYVGITKDLARRMQEHAHSGRFPADFEYEIVFEGSKKECLKKELDLRPSWNIGWNKASGGLIPPSPLGRKHSEKSRKLISENNVGFKGKKHTEASRKKMADSNPRLRACCIVCGYEGPLMTLGRYHKHTDTHKGNTNAKQKRIRTQNRPLGDGQRLS